MSDPRFQSPLSGLAPPRNLAISISEIVDRGMIDIRGDPEDRSFAAAVEAVLGTSLPRRPRSSVAAGELSVLWLSIDQWLAECPRAEAGGIARNLNEALEDIPSLVVEMSEARAIIRVQGEGVREVIMKGAPVDLTAPGFTEGTVRRLRFGELAAMVHMVGEAPDIIDLYVFRSYAVFAWEWLIATADGDAQIRLFQPQSAPTA